MLFCAAIRKDSVSLLRLRFLSRVQACSCEISLVCPLKYLYSFSSSHFCFPAIFILLLLVLSVMFLVRVVSLTLRLFMQSSSHCIDASTLSWMLASPLLPFFLTNTVCLRHLWDVMLYASSWVFLLSGPFV